MFRSLFKRVSAVVVILVIILSPFLLLFDFKKSVPVVLTVWLLSVVYFVFVKNRR